jgi:hypothetical protein
MVDLNPLACQFRRVEMCILTYDHPYNHYYVHILNLGGFRVPRTSCQIYSHYGMMSVLSHKRLVVTIIHIQQAFYRGYHTGAQPVLNVARQLYVVNEHMLIV